MKSKTAKIFIFSLFLFSFLSLLSLFFHNTTLSITLFTISYHFFERMISGVISSTIRIDSDSSFFIVNNWEMKFYKAIKIKKWKEYAPTFAPESFSVRNLNNLRASTIKSETCHILCFILSYLPPLLSLMIPFLHSSFFIFFITSFISSLFDLLLIFIQRFNRRRVEMALGRIR